jgi:hypothetical protein
VPYLSTRGLGAVSVSSLASAIAQMEGYNTPGTLAQRNNNPGNLRSGPGQVGTSGGFAVFATPDDGWAALDNQIQVNAGRGLTLNEFFAGKPGVYPGYAPSADANNPAAYAAFVASQTGADPNTPLNSLLIPSPTPTDSPGASIPGPTLADSSSPFDWTGGVDTSSGSDSSGLVIGLAVAAAGLLVWMAS